MGSKDKKQKSSDLSQLSVEEVVKAKGEVQNLLASLEDEYRNATISEKSYKELKEKNAKKLEEIKGFLIEMGMKDVAEAAPAAKAEPIKAGLDTQQKPPLQFLPMQPQLAIPAVSQQAPFAGQQPSDNLQMELIDSKIKLGVERINSILDSMKESSKSVDEKLQRLTEGQGELRAMVFEKEGSGKEVKMAVEKLQEEVTAIEPRKIEKEFGKRDKTMTEYGVKIETLEGKTDGMLKTLKDIQSILRSVGGLENIAEVNKDVSRKLDEIDRVSKSTERLSDKVQKIFVDLNKKLELFMLYKSKQDSLDELTKELMKMVDGLGVRIEDFVEKKDIMSLKNDIYGLANKVDEIKKMMDVIVPVLDVKIPEAIRSLQKEKTDIENLLSSLEESYVGQKISKASYLSTKEKNVKALDTIEKKLKREWAKFQENLQIQVPRQEQPKPAIQQAAETPPATAEKKTEQQLVVKEPTKEPAKENPKEPTKTLQKEGTKEKTEEKKQPEKKETMKQATQKESETETAGSETKKLLDDLKDSFEKGLISKEAYEMYRRMIVENSKESS